jgi:ribonuclease R
VKELHLFSLSLEASPLLQEWRLLQRTGQKTKGWYLLLLKSNARNVLSLLTSTGERLSIQAINSRLPEVADKTGAVETLLEEGLIWHAGKGRYATLKTLGMAIGTIRMHSDGSAVVFSGEPDSTRIVLEKGDTGGALDRDTVVVRLLEQIHHNSGHGGRVVDVLKRFRTRIAGIARKHGDRWFLDPLDPRVKGNIPLDPGDNKIRQGDLIGCLIEYGKNSVKVSALSSIGSPDSPSALIDSVCTDMELPEEFPEDVIRESDSVCTVPAAHSSRRDLRSIYTLTIDPVDARDFDDAISIELLPEGGYRLGVHIADVSAYAQPGSLVDNEAMKRGTSVYLPDRVIPMIPEILSNGACSLQPGEDRLTKTVFINYDSAGKRLDFSVFSSQIRSRKRLNYTEAYAILSGELSSDPELNDRFRLFAGLNKLLDGNRENRGAVDLGASEFRTDFDGTGYPSGFSRVSDDVSHRMIENFMVEANSAVAEFCRWLELDVLYRVHGDPAPEASEKLRRTLALYGFKVPGQMSPRASSLSKAVKEAEGTPLYPIVRDAVLRSMQKAVYSTENSGHYGLALRNYMHFTSPIRRYPDLIVHQAITAYEEGEVPVRSQSISELADLCSGLERRAAAAERTTTELMALLFLSRKTDGVFRGVVRAKTDFGLFIRLLEVPVEGLLHVSALKKYRHFVPADLSPGAEIVVLVERADPIERKLSLLPAEAPEENR